MFLSSIQGIVTAQMHFLWSQKFRMSSKTGKFVTSEPRKSQHTACSLCDRTQRGPEGDHRRRFFDTPNPSEKCQRVSTSPGLPLTLAAFLILAPGLITSKAFALVFDCTIKIKVWFNVSGRIPLITWVNISVKGFVHVGCFFVLFFLFYVFNDKTQRTLFQMNCS